jgi:hypothetical protein
MKVCNNITSRQLFLLLLILSLIIPSAKAANNLLPNPGFEYGNTQGWTDWNCDLSATREQAHTGSYSVRLYNRSQAWQGPVQSLLGKLETGKTYRISGSIDDLKENYVEHQILEAAKEVKLIPKSKLRLYHGHLAKKPMCTSDTI